MLCGVEQSLFFKRKMKDLENLTPLELEDYFNSLLVDNDYQGLEPRDVRNKMYRIISDEIGGEDYGMWSSRTTGTHFDMTIDGIKVEFTVSIKGTGVYQPVSKTRNKEVKGFGKVKLVSAKRNLFSMPWWEYSQDKQSIVKSGSVSSKADTNVSYTKKDNVPFSQMLLKENIDARFDKEPLVEEIVLNMAQPYLKSFMFGVFSSGKEDRVKKRKVKGQVPKDFYELLPKDFTHQELWDSTLSIVRTHHKDEIDALLETIYTQN